MPALGENDSASQMDPLYVESNRAWYSLKDSDLTRFTSFTIGLDYTEAIAFRIVCRSVQISANSADRG